MQPNSKQSSDHLSDSSGDQPAVPTRRGSVHRLVLPGLVALAVLQVAALAVIWTAKLPSAQAIEVVNSEGVTMLTARTASDNDGLFVLENQVQTLLIYTTALRGQRGDLELKEAVDLAELFGGGRGGGGRTGGGGGRQGR
jgi:hypothetical protein